MASYALLLTYSGFLYDMGEKRMGFRPLHENGFSSFWSLDSGWGSVKYEENTVEMKVLYGSLKLAVLELGKGGRKARKVTVNGQDAAFVQTGDRICLEEAREIKNVVVTYQEEV